MYLEGWDSGCGTSRCAVSALDLHLATSSDGEGEDAENSGRLVDFDSVFPIPDLAAELFAL